MTLRPRDRLLWALTARVACGRSTAFSDLQRGLVEPRATEDETRPRRSGRGRGRPERQWVPSPEARAQLLAELTTLEARPRPGVDLGPRYRRPRRAGMAA